MPELQTAKNTDYTNSGDERGHLCNAEDFAITCKKEELTFRFYNCIPQTTSANHSNWLKYESEIREWSQKEKLYIICGGYFKNKKRDKKKDIAVPEWCWKIVQSVKTKKILFCGMFTNEEESVYTELTKAQLEKKLKSKIILLK
jgi:endonuclease G